MLRKEEMKHKMSEVVYIQINRNIEVSKRTITIGDVAGVYCNDKKIENDIKHICILELKDAGENKRKKERVCMSFLAVVKAISGKYPDIEVNNLGENDFIVDYIYEKKHSKTLQIILIAFVALFTFLGSMYAIMAYNNDVNTIEIFDKVYEIFGAQEAQGAKLLEITYGIGLALGIMVFYNHFAGVRFSSDPTPIEVEMDKYEKDVDDTLIDRSAAVNEEIS
jgi:stage V sporulation protein AA